jgi:hypothetical protein
MCAICCTNVIHGASLVVICSSGHTEAGWLTHYFDSRRGAQAILNLIQQAAIGESWIAAIPMMILHRMQAFFYLELKNPILLIGSSN